MEYLNSSAHARDGYEIESINSRGAHFVDNTGAQEDAIAQSFDEKALVEALGRLDKTDRTIILWRYYFNKTSAQIAVEMNSSDAAVRKRLSRALEKLRLLLSEKNT